MQISSLFPQGIEWSRDIRKTRNKLVIELNNPNKAGKSLSVLGNSLIGLVRSGSMRTQPAESKCPKKEIS